ncbi:MAG: hypothetical protein KGP34_07530 [Bacteroidetes bacterium]|nr:hypothetical protein [Bacteroidota bacterium]
MTAWAALNLKAQIPLHNLVYGELRYDNTAATPLAGVPVVLKSLLGNTVASDTTDFSGAYSLSGFANGNYILDALQDGNWGGVNATDALLINRHFTSLQTLSPLRQMAADVNANQAINSADALLVNRRITGQTTAFVAGNWVSDRPSLTAQGTPIQMNLRMLCVGDVNGSHAPIPVAPVITLDTILPGIRSGAARVRFLSPGAGVFERGLCWGLAPSPTIAQSTAVAGSGGYDFALVFGNSTWDTAVRYVRAYARTSLGVTYSNEKAFKPYSIGSAYAGGIILDLDSSGESGIVCAAADLGLYAWGCPGSLVPGTSTSLGSGSANTDSILNSCMARPIAASVCSGLVANEYSDWYLPSRDEMQLIYNRLHLQGRGDFGSGWYWTSSQSGSSTAWALNFGTGAFSGSASKGLSGMVRPVRTFRPTRWVVANNLPVQVLIQRPPQAINPPLPNPVVDVLVVFHGTVLYDSNLVVAANNTLDEFKGILNRQDMLLVSVAYPGEQLLFGDNIAYAEAALLWVRNLASSQLGVTVHKVFLAGHSQGGYLVTRLNTMHATNGVIANAPGPLNLVYRCGLEESGVLALGSTCSKIQQVYGTTQVNPNEYMQRSLLSFTTGHRSDILFVQGLNDSPIQMYSWPTFKQSMQNCNNCQIRQFVEVPNMGHTSIFLDPTAISQFNTFINTR